MVRSYRWLGAGLLAVAAASASAETVVNDSTLSELGDGSNWLGYGRNYTEQRFSPLTDINAETVKPRWWSTA
jgi:quinohemoprotein ethanol dehydrogenase